MIPYLSQSSAARHAPAPLVLIADDDARVLELLQLAFTQEHFRVITALDGDEAIRRALAERPDLVVLDVRLPRKNGFEVCDWLRHDPEDPQVPILFVSAAGDTDVRIEGISRGADDFMSKPFSPRELIARARRLLARAGESRTHQRRAEALARDLSHAQDEARRAHAELGRERRLRELASGIGRELQGTLDLDELAARTLVAARRQLGSGTLALLVREPQGDGEVLRVLAGRGETWERCSDLRLDPAGELAELLAGLGRPALVHELQRWGSLRAELAPFATAGVALFAPLRVGRELEGLLVADDRTDGAGWSADDRDAVAALCDLAAPALRSAWRFARTQDHALELAAVHAHVQPRAAQAAAEAASIAAAAAATLRLPERELGLLRHAVAFGPWGWGEGGQLALATLAHLDPTHRVATLRALIDGGESLECTELATQPERQAAAVVGVCARYEVGRTSGRSAAESWQTAMSWAAPALDPDVTAALALAFAAHASNTLEHRAA